MAGFRPRMRGQEEEAKPTGLRTAKGLGEELEVVREGIRRIIQVGQINIMK